MEHPGTLQSLLMQVDEWNNFIMSCWLLSSRRNILSVGFLAMFEVVCLCKKRNVR
jgi:hypothetical protein